MMILNTSVQGNHRFHLDLNLFSVYAKRFKTIPFNVQTGQQRILRIVN